MEFDIEIYAMLIMKKGKLEITERIELPNKKKPRILEEKETLKYLGILKADTIKHAEMKTKNKKDYAGERENYSKPN